MNKSFIMHLALVCITLCNISLAKAQSSLIPTTAISSMPIVDIKDISQGRNEFTIFNTLTATAVVKSDNKRSKRTITEENNEFVLVYDIFKENGKRYLEYESCEGIVRLGYLGGTNIYNSESNFIPAEEIVRRLALYRLIGLAKEYGADALLVPTITTTAASEKKIIMYKSEITAKLVKIKND